VSVGHRAEDGGDERPLGIGLSDVPGAELAAGGVHERHDDRQVPGGGDVGAEGAVGLAALDERVEDPDPSEPPIS
jgi:hypothetical protein